MNILTKNISNNSGFFADSLLNSYSQIFFSTYKPFAALIMAVTFIDFYTGLVGLLAVVATSLAAFFLNLDKPTIAKGLYGFNSLLVGLGLGMYYSLSLQLVLIVVLAAIFSLFVAVSLQGIIGKYHLPYLSIPFLIGIWTFTLATKHFEALGISERGIYTMNELYVVGGHSLVKLYESFNAAAIPEILKVYFISLSAILFQYNVLAGILIAIGLLLFSRIAFSLSLIGFTIAFLFYHYIDANITLIEYSYIGFNYILTAIAIGGFFLVPSVRSYFSVAILVPLVAIVSISLSSIFLKYNLAIYSLPFNVLVLLFLYTLKFRMDYSPRLTEVYYQYNSPEKNLYTFINYEQRFQFLNYFPLQLPFMGVWKVSQGHNGEHTHQNQWQHAWDFIITNESDKQFTNDGYYVEDYLCYNKPVVASGDGIIEEVVNNIEDNAIGMVNLEHNWGNTIIIKHNEHVYSKVSHLKKGSAKVKKGDFVKAGQVIGKCGNSGRSPYPHLHFQIQANPYIGSVTMHYPINNYLVHNNKQTRVQSLLIPKEEELISNAESNSLISHAYQWVPGQTLIFNVEGNSKHKRVEWDVRINAINQTYLQCKRTGAKAYFSSADSQLYFSQYEGNKKDLLYFFYLGNFKVQKIFYEKHKLTDAIPLHLSFPMKYLWMHDIIAPFFQLAKAIYTLNYSFSNDHFNPSEMKLDAEVKNCFLNKSINKQSFQIQLNTKGIESFTITNNKRTIILKREFSDAY